MKLIRLARLGDHIGQNVRTCGLLTQFSLHTTPMGVLMASGRLGDATTDIDFSVDTAQLTKCLCPPIPGAALVICQVRGTRKHPEINLQRLVRIPPSYIVRATDFLPRSQCPLMAWAALDRLATLERQLPRPLSDFASRVLMDPAVSIQFLRCRASGRHHHSYPGGLLVHSTEGLDAVHQAVRFALPDDVWAPAIGQIAYLFHDIGKLRTVGETRRPAYAFATPHETHTIEILAPRLAWLGRQEPGLAAALRIIFNYLAVQARYRSTSQYTVAEIVAKIDQWSAGRFRPNNTQAAIGQHFGGALLPTSLPPGLAQRF